MYALLYLCVEFRFTNVLFHLHRDVAIYAASVMREGIDPITSLIADIALRPRLNFEEVNLISFIFKFY